MKIRLAKQCDAVHLAALYKRCNDDNAHSFVSRLGVSFIRKYYEITLSTPSSIAVCAVDDNDQILGFASGTLDSSEQMTALKRRRLSLLVACFPALLRNPSLIRRMWARSNSQTNQFIITEGARWDYWAWDVHVRVPGGSLLLQLKWLGIAKMLGATSVFIEVNCEAKGTIAIHRQSGALIVKEFTTPEGLPRIVMRYDLASLDL